MSATGRDDRRHERFEADGEVILRVLLTRCDDVASIRARVRDVGLGGLYVETEADIPPGALADLELRLDAVPGPRCHRGHLTPLPAPLYCLAIR